MFGADKAFRFFLVFPSIKKKITYIRFGLPSVSIVEGGLLRTSVKTLS